MTHLLKLLGKMYRYEMNPTRTVGVTEWTRDAGRTDRRADGVKPIYPQQLRCAKGIIMGSIRLGSVIKDHKNGLAERNRPVSTGLIQIVLLIWWNFHPCLHQKLSFSKLSVWQMISSKRCYFCFSIVLPQNVWRWIPVVGSRAHIIHCLSPLEDRSEHWRGGYSSSPDWLETPHWGTESGGTRSLLDWHCWRVKILIVKSR